MAILSNLIVMRTRRSLRSTKHGGGMQLYQPNAWPNWRCFFVGLGVARRYVSAKLCRGYFFVKRLSLASSCGVPTCFAFGRFKTIYTNVFQIYYTHTRTYYIYIHLCTDLCLYFFVFIYVPIFVLNIFMNLFMYLFMYLFLYFLIYVFVFQCFSNFIFPFFFT